jgi:LemA protein
MEPLWITAGLCAVALLWLIVAYNGLVGARNYCDTAWSGIDVQLKRRHDLVPNLVATAQGYARHEAQLFEAVARARAEALRARSPHDLGRAEGALQSAIGQVFALKESYPELRSDHLFLELQDQLADTEDKVQAARRIYNGNVRDYKNRLETFPTVLVARWFGFQGREYFEIEEPAERAVPRVG